MVVNTYIGDVKMWLKTCFVKLLDLDEQPFHAGANVRLGEERTGSFQPEHALQHPEPLLQQVRRVSLQVVHTLPCHYLHTTARTRVEVRMSKGMLFNRATVFCD